MKAAVVALVAAVQAELVPVPGGHLVESACIIEVPPTECVDVDQLRASSVCDVGLPETYLPNIYASDAHFRSDEPLTSFTANWIVPAEPQWDHGQVVYFWPGFKARKPEVGFPVLQPVLQWGQHGKFWELQAWFVYALDPHYPAVTASSIRVSPGDHIKSYMRRSADGKTWTVSGKDVTTGQDSTLHIKSSRAGNTDFHYAMLVNENLFVYKWCWLMPVGREIVFTNVTVNGKVPVWTTRAKCMGSPNCDCDNTAVVDGAHTVHLGWSRGPPTANWRHRRKRRRRRCQGDCRKHRRARGF